MDYLKKYQTETKRNPYCWNAKGEYVRSGSYNDDYVKWLEKQLLQTDVMQRNCNSFGCVDPDNSGQCIYCGKILDND